MNIAHLQAQEGSSLKYSKGVARKAFDILLAAELVRITDQTRHAGGAGEHRWHLPVQLRIEPHRVKLYATQHQYCSQLIQNWLNSA